MSTRISIHDLIRQTPGLPSLPTVVRDVIDALSDDRASAVDVATKLAADQVLSLKVLRLANSSYYGMARTVGTIDEAVRVLGTNTVKTLAISVALTTSLAPAATFDLATFWRYGLHAGVAARHLATITFGPVDRSFTVALLHGIGRLVMEAGMPEAMAAFAKDLSLFPSPERRDAERARFGFSYAEVGRELAGHWNFPESLGLALLGCAEPVAGDPDAALHAIVHVAAWIARVHEERWTFEDAEAGFPAGAAAIASLTLSSALHDMPPLADLTNGLEDVLAA